LPRLILISFSSALLSNTMKNNRRQFRQCSKHPFSPSIILCISPSALFLGFWNLKMKELRLFETTSARYHSTLRSILEDVTSSTVVRTSNLASLYLLSIALQ
jgi:hypothetical protein